MPNATRSRTAAGEALWLRPAVDRLAAELRRHHQATADHSHRLARAARRLADRLGLDPLQATEAELVAIVHDVGKLAIPADLLDRSGEISDEDRTVLRSHAVAGADLLAQEAGLTHLAEAVRHVHEAWDGSGYPDGLARTAIPRLARLVSVVDAYDAMVHDRSYRAALSAEEARMRLARAAGRQFDSVIVSAYLHELHKERERRFLSDPVGLRPPRPAGTPRGSGRRTKHRQSRRAD